MNQPSALVHLTLAVCILVGCGQSPVTSDAYKLTVKLNTPDNQDFVIETPVTVGRPFKLTKLNGEIRNTISGVLGAPVDDKFPLDLTVSEWASETSNIEDTGTLHLELDKARSRGLVSSFVYSRTVTLSRMKPPHNKTEF